MVLVSLREAIHPNLPNVLKNISPDISSNLGCRPRLESHYISGWADVRANVLLSAPIIEGRATSVMRSGLIQECQKHLLSLNLLFASVVTVLEFLREYYNVHICKTFFVIVVKR